MWRNPRSRASSSIARSMLSIFPSPIYLFPLSQSSSSIPSSLYQHRHDSFIKNSPPSIPPQPSSNPHNGLYILHHNPPTRTLEASLPRRPLQNGFPRICFLIATPSPQGLTNTLPPSRPLLHLPRFLVRAAREQTQPSSPERKGLRVRNAYVYF
jgi:hypothetical protein